MFKEIKISTMKYRLNYIQINWFINNIVDIIIATILIYFMIEIYFSVKEILVLYNMIEDENNNIITEKA
jgi:hypothetical protein